MYFFTFYQKQNFMCPYTKKTFLLLFLYNILLFLYNILSEINSSFSNKKKTDGECIPSTICWEILICYSSFTCRISSNAAKAVRISSRTNFVFLS